MHIFFCSHGSKYDSYCFIIITSSETFFSQYTQFYFILRQGIFLLISDFYYGNHKISWKKKKYLSEYTKPLPAIDRLGVLAAGLVAHFADPQFLKKSSKVLRIQVHRNGFMVLWIQILETVPMCYEFKFIETVPRCYEFKFIETVPRCYELKFIETVLWYYGFKF